VGQLYQRYDAAVGSSSEADVEAAREWLLTYNRGDVEATLAIRDWLVREAESIPPIESLDPLPGRGGGI